MLIVVVRTVAHFDSTETVLFIEEGLPRRLAIVFLIFDVDQSMGHKSQQTVPYEPNTAQFI